jgi:hypothetical protein
MRTNMDYLVLGPFLLDKRAQPAANAAESPREHELVLD